MPGRQAAKMTNLFHHTILQVGRSIAAGLCNGDLNGRAVRCQQWQNEIPRQHGRGRGEVNRRNLLDLSSMDRKGTTTARARRVFMHLDSVAKHGQFSGQYPLPCLLGQPLMIWNRDLTIAPCRRRSFPVQTHCHAASRTTADSERPIPVKVLRSPPAKVRCLQTYMTWGNIG